MNRKAFVQILILIALVFALGGIPASVAYADLLSMNTGVQLANILLAPLTFGLLWLTWVLANETRKTRLQGKHPHIVITIEPNKYIMFFDLVVENIGAGPAFELSTTLRPDILVKDGERTVIVSSSSFLRMQILKPKQRFSQFLGRWGDFDPRQSLVTCTCKDVDGTSHTFTNVIDLESFASMHVLGSDNLEKIAQHLEKIERTIDHLGSARSRINVNTYTVDDRQAEKMQQEEERQKRREESAAAAKAATNDAPKP